MTDQPKSTPRRLLLGVALAAAFAMGGVAFSVLPAAAHGVATMHGGGHGGGHGGDHGPGMMSQEHIDKVLDAVEATPDQKARIKAILTPAFERLHGAHNDLNQTHAQLHAIFIAPTIDRQALESLRAAQVAKLDTASKVMVQALADAAEVLSPAQRAKLGKMMAERHHGG